VVVEIRVARKQEAMFSYPEEAAVSGMVLVAKPVSRVTVDEDVFLDGRALLWQDRGVDLSQSEDNLEECCRKAEVVTLESFISSTSGRWRQLRTMYTG